MKKVKEASKLISAAAGMTIEENTFCLVLGFKQKCIEVMGELA